jgi:hypothetical protein
MKAAANAAFGEIAQLYEDEQYKILKLSGIKTTASVGDVSLSDKDIEKAVYAHARLEAARLVGSR